MTEIEEIRGVSWPQVDAQAFVALIQSGMEYERAEAIVMLDLKERLRKWEREQAHTAVRM